MAQTSNPWDVLIEWLAKMDPSLREILMASLALLVLFLVGTSGYVFLEGWGWLDGLYMTFITLTTIGFQEVNPLSETSRLFTVGIALTGIGLVTFVAARASQLLLASERLRERRLMKRIDNLSDHYIICGYGRVGKRLVEDLGEAGHPFVVIDTADEEIEHLRLADRLHLQGNAEEEHILRQAGIERARGLILCLPDDSSNVFVTLTAREMNPDLFILARTVDHDNRTKLLHAGADKVIAPSEVGADRMAQVVLRPNVDEFMEQVLHTEALSLQINEVEIHPNAPLAGKTLAESNFRQQFEAIVIGIIDGDAGTMSFNPSPTSPIRAGDILIVLGESDWIDRLQESVCVP